MPVPAIKTKDELILEIKSSITAICGNDAGKPVNLDNFLFNESGRSGSGSKISISCLFINEDGAVCADMYRSGSAGCVDFICGLALNSVNEKILGNIMSSLNAGSWSVEEYPVFEKQKKKNLVSNFKIPFLQKGA